MKFKSEVRKDIEIEYDWLNSIVRVIKYSLNNPNIIKSIEVFKLIMIQSFSNKDKKELTLLKEYNEKKKIIKVIS